MKSYRLLATLAAISGCLLALPAKADLLLVSDVVFDQLAANAAASIPAGTQGWDDDLVFIPAQTDSDEQIANDDSAVNAWANLWYWGDWSARAESWGNSGGSYGADAFASLGKATAEFHRLVSITNNSTGALDYSLDFLINGGSLFAGVLTSADQTYSQDNPGYPLASYSLSISRGATTLFTSAASLDSNGLLTTSGTTLDGGVDGASWFGFLYNWQATYLSLGLGTLDQGESMDIHIDLVVSAYADCIANYAPWCEASVYFSDPGGISGSPIAITSGPASNNTNVPEPGTLSLLALGLTGFALRARRNRRRG